MKENKALWVKFKVVFQLLPNPLKNPKTQKTLTDFFSDAKALF